MSSFLDYADEFGDIVGAWTGTAGTQAAADATIASAQAQAAEASASVQNTQTLVLGFIAVAIIGAGVYVASR